MKRHLILLSGITLSVALVAHPLAQQPIAPAAGSAPSSAAPSSNPSPALQPPPISDPAATKMPVVREAPVARNFPGAAGGMPGIGAPPLPQGAPPALTLDAPKAPTAVPGALVAPPPPPIRPPLRVVPEVRGADGRIAPSGSPSISGVSGGGLATPPAVAGDPFIQNGSPREVLVAADTDNRIAPNYHLIIETFDLPRLDLLEMLNAKGGDGERYQMVAAWAKAGRAKAAGFFGINVRSGMRTVYESIHEVRYPIEFAPPAAEEDFAYPTAYETRNVGDTFEVELNVDQDGQRGTMNFVIQRVRFMGFSDVQTMPGRRNSTTAVPIFRTGKVSSSVTFASSAPRFLGTFSTPAGEDAHPSETARVAFGRIRPDGNFLRGKPAVVTENTSLRLDYSFFSLRREAARDLLLAGASPQVWYDTLRQMTTQGSARLDHASSTLTLSGNRAVTEEILEVRYGTTTRPPSIPGPQQTKTEVKVPPASGRPGDAANSSKPADVAVASTLEMKAITPADYPKKSPIPGVADSFETRNVGFTGEVEPVLRSDGTRVEITLAPHFTTYRGNLPVTGWAKEYPPQPLFETRKFSGNVSAVIEEQHFLSTYNIPVDTGAFEAKEDDLVTLGFVRASVIP